MSKIDEIKAAYEDFRRQRREYNDACYSFAAGMRLSFVEYLGCSEELIKFYPPSKGVLMTRGRTPTTYTQAGAMELEDDGFWHLGFSVNVPDAGLINYVIMFRRVDGVFQIRFKRDDDFEAHGSGVEELRDFFDYLFSYTKEFYETHLEEMISGEKQRQPIGFRPAVPSGDGGS